MILNRNVRRKKHAQMICISSAHWILEGMMLTKREDSLSHDVHHPIPFCPSHFSLPFAGAGFNFFFLLFDGETVEAARQA
jgi:hypothetical protein